MVSVCSMNWVLNRTIFSPYVPVAGYFCAGIVAIICVMRAKALLETMKLLKQDQSQYDRLWKTLCSNEDNVAGIEHLGKVVRMIGLDEIDYCRQHNRMLASKLTPPLRAKFLSQMTPDQAKQLHPLLREMGRWSIPGRPDLKSQITSTNQLYFQAAIANLLLIQKLKAWASVSSGMFRCVEGDTEEFLEWNEIKDNPSRLSRVHWTLMKGHDRTMEKLVRSYGNNPARLVDIARSAIVFRSMEHLTMCLGAIVTDNGVRVERLKNRLSPSYDPGETWGYRDVSVNLMMVCKEARAVGVELHMCEVQLMLQDFAHVKNIGESPGRLPLRGSDAWPYRKNHG